jgi:hypothetical protein
MRISFACSMETLEDALRRIARVVSAASPVSKDAAMAKRA